MASPAVSYSTHTPSIAKILEEKASKSSAPAATVILKSSSRFPPGGAIVEGEGTYIGGFNIGGKREGDGKLRYFNGDVYEGDWLADERHGTGRLKYSSGAVYDGCFLNDARHGYGSLRYANGDVYSGAWEEDTKQGVGLFSWAAQRTTYEGSFHGGLMHGRGKYTFADGCVYEGQYVMGERRGRGVLTLADGTRQAGEWHGLERQLSRKESEAALTSFRPDLALKRDPTKMQVEKMLQLEEAIESLALEGEGREGFSSPTGEMGGWEPYSP